MNKKYELLKIKYENTRTWLLSFIALALPMSIGYYVINDLSFKNKLSIIIGIVIIAIIFLYILQTIRYKKILNYLRN
ncbi:MAG: hypothetical protein QJ16_C0016G0003 [archaeon GW2011_AR1]|nr:MAG: hypothetical protein QJ16_C0016G0003 [archaeon GW2011_AR1]